MSVSTNRPEKAELRLQLLDAARNHPASERIQLSSMIQQRIQVMERWKTASGVALYRAIAGEVSLAPLFDVLAAEGRQGYLPRVDAHDTMSLRAWQAGAPLELTGIGVRQPGPDAPEGTPGNVQLILVPGLGFDRHGTRLGRGAGYYDRMLPRFMATALVVGVCFAFQRVAWIPREPWDVPVHAVVTEEGVFIPEPLTDSRP